jgi:hypothetical protein
MLSFLFPAFLIGAVAAAVPIVLHLFRRQAAPRVPFSAVRLLKEAPVESSLRKRLRELLLLAFRVSALVVLAFAFARPYLAAGGGQGSRVTIVAIDRSFSMGAPKRFDRARALARDAINRAQAGDLVGVLAFDDHAEVISDVGAERGAARAALDRVAPGFGGTRYATALARAGAMAAGRPGRVVLVTDLQQSGWTDIGSEAAPRNLDVEVADIGEAPPNLALTAVERDHTDVTVRLLNTGQAPKSARVVVMVGDRRAADTSLVAVPGTNDVKVAVTLPAAGTLKTEIDDRDGLPADNVRFSVLDPPPPAPVVIVTGSSGEAFYVERAFGVTGEAARFSVRTLGTQALESMSLDGTAVVVVLSTRGLEAGGTARLRAFVEAGGGLLVAAGPDVEPDAVNGIVAGSGVPPIIARPAERQLTLTPADVRHPIFRPFGAVAADFGEVRFTRAAELRGATGVRVLARFNDGAPAVTEARLKSGRIILFASDFGHRGNDFPLHPTFVPFLHEAAKYLAGAREAPGEYLIGQTPDAEREPGIVRLGGTGQRVAVNVDVRESNPARLSGPEFAALTNQLKLAHADTGTDDGSDREGRQGFWRYGLMLVAAFLVAEAFLGRT